LITSLKFYKITIMELIIGKVYSAKEFCYTNKNGGTGLSRPFSIRFKGEEYFEHSIRVKVTKAWFDYEIGWRSLCVPENDQPELIEFLNRNAKNKILFVGEFDIEQ
jgi:hypothetical protein